MEQRTQYREDLVNSHGILASTLQSKTNVLVAKSGMKLREIKSAK
jgi:hypothetical protein